jgi:hypothetical protein
VPNVYQTLRHREAIHHKAAAGRLNDLARLGQGKGRCELHARSGRFCSAFIRFSLLRTLCIAAIDNLPLFRLPVALLYRCEKIFIIYKYIGYNRL